MAHRRALRSIVAAAGAAALSIGLLTTVPIEPAASAGTVPYEPGAPVDAFPQTGGTPLRSAASLAAAESRTGVVDAASAKPQALPASTTASVSGLTKGWAAAGDSVVAVRASRVVDNGRSTAAGADAVGDGIQVEIQDLNGNATAGGLNSPAMKSVGTPTLQIGLEKTSDAQTAGGDNDVDVRVSYASFADAYGGNWSDRLQVTALPACSITTPKVAACQVAVPVPSANDPGSQTLAFTAAPPLATSAATPAAPSASTMQSCFNGSTATGGSQTAARTSDDRWDGDPTNQSSDGDQDTDAAAVSNDDSGYDDTDVADDPYNDVTSPSARQASTTAVKPAPELNTAASDSTACQGLVYQVRGGTGGYAMATAAAAGGSGSVPSTLETSADWQVGEGSGEFNWSYPIAMPTGQADEAPQLSLNYSSAVADGMTGPSPAQASQVGLGWSLEPGHISRTYAACGDDDTSDTSGDLCWRTEGTNLVNDLSLVLEGHATRLIRDTGGALRLQDDPSWRVETYGGPGNSTWQEGDGTAGPSNADGDNEAFRLTSPDGTRYYFGYGTKSVWTVPVRGNDTGEPCYGRGVESPACVQAWQWNLDRVVDADGNRVKYTYDIETNNYRYNATQVVSYDRSGYLTSVQYGFPRPTPAPANESIEPQAAVEFVMAGRCNVSIGGDGNNDADNPCAAQDAPRMDPQGYRDAPTDLLCGASSGGACNNTSPAFFSLKRYKRILTHRGKLTTPGNALSGPVTDRYVLRHSMEDPDGPKTDTGGGDEPDLWLDQIAHQPTPDGNGVPVTGALPPVKFQGTFYDNLVVGEGGGKELQKKRLTTIINELGGRTIVDYGHQRPCAASDVPTTKTAFSSVRDCFAPRRPNGSETNFTWYHKYLVKTLTLGDQALSLQQLQTGDPSLGTLRKYQYTYRGDPGWRYDGSAKNVPAKYRSWSDWRGYQTTLIRTMSVDKQNNAGIALDTAKSVRRVVVYRGLYNSRKDYGSGLRITAADGGYVATVERGLNSTQLPDRNALRGQVAEETVLDPPAASCQSNCVAKWISRTYHGYTVYRSALDNVNLAAYFTGEDITRTHDRVTRDTGTKLSWDRHHTVNRTFDPGGTNHRGLSLGTVTEVLDRGAATNDDKSGDKNTCTATTWVNNDTLWIRVPTAVQVADESVGTSGGVCTSCPTCTVARSRSASFYDGTTAATQTGAALTRGRMTRVETYIDGTNKITTQTGYDKYGRVAGTIDGRGFRTITAYNESENGETVDDLPVKVTTTTNQSQTVTRLEKRRGLPVSITDYGNDSISTDDATTTTDYDGYGRVIAVRSPNLQGAGGASSIAYDYTVNSDANKPARIKSTTRRDASASDTSFSYMDGWGRTIETQTPQADGDGRVVSATAYNELGQPYVSMPVIANSDAPGSGLLNAKQDNTERYELTTYDAASRVTRVWHMAKNAIQKYSTFYKPQGDRTITTQPVIGATVTYVDGWNRTSMVQQYSNDAVDVSSNREHSATYTYDGNNHLLDIKSTLQTVDQHWTYGYDLAGRRSSTSDPDAGSSTSVYDANSNEIATNNATDGTVKTLYDNQDRPVKRFKVVSGNPTDCADSGSQTDCERIATWSYDSATRGDGRLASSTSFTQLGTYTDAVTGYDLDGNPLGEAYTYPDNITGTPSGNISLLNSWAYNDADLITNVNYGAIANLAATSVATTYGINAQVRTMTATQAGQPSVNLLTATYDKVGQPLRALSETSNTAKHLNREYAWDNATGRLTRVGGSAFGTLDYTYDLIGNPTSATEHTLYSDSPEDPAAAWCYTYEPLNRLKSVKTGSSASNNCANPAADTTLIGANQNLRYNYSADRLVSVASTNGGTTTQSEYDYKNGKPHQTSQIRGGTTSDPALPPNVTLAYDNAGRITTLTPSSAPATTSTYNPTGTLKTSTQSGTGGITTSYAYDPGGIRVARRDTVSGTGGYINSVRYLGNSELTVKTPNGGSTVSNGRRIFTTPAGAPLAIQAGTGTTAVPAAPIWTLQLGDVQQSLRFTRNQTAGTDSRPTYRPFGQPITVSSNGERGFLNRPQDPNGDVRLDSRNYQPQLNVLTAPDPLLDPKYPQNLNPYSYAGNNPTASSDNSGLSVNPDGTGDGSSQDINTDSSHNFTGPPCPNIYCADQYPDPGTLTDPSSSSSSLIGNPLDELKDLAKGLGNVAAGVAISLSGINNPNSSYQTLSASEGSRRQSLGATQSYPGILLLLTLPLGGSPASSLSVRVAERFGITRLVERRLAARGALSVIGSGFSDSERYAAETLSAQGKRVVLREADSSAGRTSDLLVNGVPYDVYSPTTGNLNRIVSSIASKGSQVRGGGVVLDLSKSPLTPSEVGDILPRVQGVSNQISDIIVLGGR